jgi:hypothetical protein
VELASGLPDARAVPDRNDDLFAQFGRMRDAAGHARSLAQSAWPTPRFEIRIIQKR